MILPAAGASTRYFASGGDGAGIAGDTDGNEGTSARTTAGSGLGGGLGGIAAHRSKLDEDLGGRSVLRRSVELFRGRAEVCAVIVAGPREDAAFAAFSERHGDTLSVLGCVVVRGGARDRWETVREALAAVPEDATHIGVHDAARPVTPGSGIDRVFAAAERVDAVIPGVEVDATVKRVGEVIADDRADPLAGILGGAPEAREIGRVVESTLERRGLMLVQTPQVFERRVLERAYAQADLSGTDDATLVERLGERVVCVPGDVRNVKITRAGDVELARVLGGLGPARARPDHLKF